MNLNPFEIAKSFTNKVKNSPDLTPHILKKARFHLFNDVPYHLDNFNHVFKEQFNELEYLIYLEEHDLKITDFRLEIETSNEGPIILSYHLKLIFTFSKNNLSTFNLVYTTPWLFTILDLTDFSNRHYIQKFLIPPDVKLPEVFFKRISEIDFCSLLNNKGHLSSTIAYEIAKQDINHLNQTTPSTKNVDNYITSHFKKGNALGLSLPKSILYERETDSFSVYPRFKLSKPPVLPFFSNPNFPFQ